MKKLRKHLVLLPLIICLLTSPGLSQDKPEGKPDSLAAEEWIPTIDMDAVVVTGTRYEKKIIDIPYPVLRIDNSQFQYSKKVGMNDVMESVPGMFLQSRYGNHDVRISIRGFGSRSNSGIRGVRILLDGIPESEPDGQTRIEAIDFNSVGRIEIVKGNLSSLYPNAPGGVVNFINDVYFPSTFAVQFNEFGSFNLRRNGIKTGIRTPDYTFLATYGYHNYKGYRDHNEDYWHIFNTVLETTPNNSSNLQILGYYVDGLIRLPGSLAREQFEENPFQAQQRDIDRDSKRITKKGRLGIRFSTALDEARNNELEFTGYATIKYFERAKRNYRIINRYGLGANLRFVNKSHIFGHYNEFSVGGELQFQNGPVESYDNINGSKGDNLTRLINNKMFNGGLYFLNSFSLIDNRFDLLLSGRWDETLFDQVNRLFEATKATATFNDFTPKLALNYKLNPFVAIYTSVARSFTSPAGNELENYPGSSDPNKLINPDLTAQRSKNFELGIKGNTHTPEARWFNKIYFEATIFKYIIDREIVPFEVFGDVFFRNAAKTDRTGLELGASVEIISGLHFDGSYTFSHFIYGEYTARSIEIDSIGNIVAIDRDFAGNFTPSVPKHNLFLSLSYSRKLAQPVTGFVKTGLRAVGGMWVDDQNSDKTSGFRVLDFTLGLDVAINRFSLLFSGGVNNIFDNTFVEFININSARGEFYEPGEPRNYFASINMGYRF